MNFKEDFASIKSQGHRYFFKWNNTFLHTPFDAFFNSVKKYEGT